MQGCKKKDDKDPYADIKGSYFSIKQFTLDEWQTFHGSPFTILKTVKEVHGDQKTARESGNVKIDSSFTNSDTLNWGTIFRTFFESDISDHKFLGKYTYNQFDDNQEDTRNFYYRAIDDDMFTQKLLITIDPVNNKVKGIYIETIKKTMWGETKQNLYYAPSKTIQIQTDEKPAIGPRRYNVTQYYFLWT